LNDENHDYYKTRESFNKLKFNLFGINGSRGKVQLANPTSLREGEWVSFRTRLLAVFGLFAPGWGSLAADAEPSRPNILYLYVDDMGWGSVGPNGQWGRREQGLPSLRTPNLDRLAKEGVNFTRAYGCSVCSPARSSQQCGFHQGHTFSDWNDPDNAKKAMRADEVLLGDALSGAGYAAGYWGKWGYGGSRSHRNPEIVNVQTLPTSHGYGHVVAELHHVRAHTFFQPTLWTAPAPRGAIGGLELKPNSMAKWKNRSGYPELPARQNHPDYPETAYCDDVYAFAALDFVREQAQVYRETGQPFFGLLAVQVPHAPFLEIEALPEWDAAYRDDPQFAALPRQAKQWAAMITRIDGHLGNLLAALKDPDGDGDRSDSVAAETLVLFQSDNGGPQHRARKVYAANGGLRGSKGGIYEGGIRVPTILRWPARIGSESVPLRAGSSSDRILDVTDLLPTFCELAGVPAPVGVDGVSIAPTLTGEGTQREREFVIHETPRSQSIIRGRHKLIRTKQGLELYDCAADPAETKDLAPARPDLVEELKELLLGELVDEPNGFATTYHRWTGGDSAMTSDADNWSDYVYANAGIAYLKDEGAPRLSWIAVLENENGSRSSAVADADLEVLGLEIRGGKEPAAWQELVLGRGVTLNGRNEVRVSRGGRLVLGGATVSSQRWLEVRPGGELCGPGTVQADLFHEGTLVVQPGKPLRVEGTAYLSGKVAAAVGEGAELKSGTVLPILVAERIRGAFRNGKGFLVSGDGIQFEVMASDTSVSLRVP